MLGAVLEQFFARYVTLNSFTETIMIRTQQAKGDHAMAGPDGQTTDALIAKLAEEPFAFDFFAAVRRLQSRFPSFPRIGHSRRRIRTPSASAQNPALDFAPSTLRSGA